MKDGFDVRGFFYWTLIDNFEWNFAWVRPSHHAALCCANLSTLPDSAVRGEQIRLLSIVWHDA